MVEGMLLGGRECVCVGFGQGGGSTGGMPTTWGVGVVVDISNPSPNPVTLVLSSTAKPQQLCSLATHLPRVVIEREKLNISLSLSLSWPFSLLG